MRIRVLLMVILAAMVSHIVPLFAQQSPVSEAYGPSSFTWVTLSYLDFRSSGGSVAYSQTGYNFAPGEPTTVLEAPLHLPTGAQFYRIEIDHCHVDGGEIFIELLEGSGRPVPITRQLLHMSAGGTGSTGCGTMVYGGPDLSSILPVDNSANLYFLSVRPSTNVPFDTGNSIASIRVGYKLGVSPATTTSFEDVPPTHIFYQYIEALKAAGITDGCAPQKFCPDAPVTRGQVAKFLAVALGLHWPDY